MIFRPRSLGQASEDYVKIKELLLQDRERKCRQAGYCLSRLAGILEFWMQVNGFTSDDVNALAEVRLAPLADLNVVAPGA